MNQNHMSLCPWSRLVYNWHHNPRLKLQQLTSMLYLTTFGEARRHINQCRILNRFRSSIVHFGTMQKSYEPIHSEPSLLNRRHFGASVCLSPRCRPSTEVRSPFLQKERCFCLIDSVMVLRQERLEFESRTREQSCTA